MADIIELLERRDESGLSLLKETNPVGFLEVEDRIFEIHIRQGRAILMPPQRWDNVDSPGKFISASTLASIEGMFENVPWYFLLLV